MRKRFLLPALLLALALCLCPAAHAEGETIHIYTAEDLLALASDCSLDSWSDGKRVVLENDLSLSASGFFSIPIFNGEFDGGGHTICDLELLGAQSPCGFFLETGKDADIHDLRLSGRVVTQGSDSTVGGVAGVNRGFITRCSFDGEVSANSAVGGIAGKNEAGGIIDQCQVSGSVRGLGQTGGVVGENTGAVRDCENRAYVNTESVDPALRLESIDFSSFLNFLHSLRADNAGITADVGGIAGKNSGFLERCANFGAVGYLHLGYNVGGIAGRSDGYIAQCANNGEIYGRRDVGGVVGQAEPLTELREAQNLLAGVSYRLEALNRSLNDVTADARSASGDITARIENLNYFLYPVIDAINALDITDPESFFYMRDVLSENLWAIGNELVAIREGADQQADILLADLDEISRNLTALSGTALQTVNLVAKGDGEDKVVDASADSDGEDITYGKTVSCDNNGSVYGDYNVGGVAGSLSVESDLEPEAELLSGSAGSLIRSHLDLRAVVTGCVNRGAVTARHACAGGIVGRMDLGAVTHCAAYGSAQVEEGDYAGGVCALCYGSVKSCCAKCSLSAARYVGGAVGNGYRGRGAEERSSTVSGCYILAEIRNDPQFAGAISGGGEGRYEDNFFVDSGYAGLNRLSIRGKAEPIPFEDFAAVENLPEECRRFTLRFVADGVVLKEIPFDYGASFDRSVFPEPARRGGAYAVWDRSDLSDLRFDTTVTAEYRMDETVLRSAEEREDGRAAVYVDGQFQRGDELKLTFLPVAEEDLRAFTGSWRDTVREQLNSIFREREPDYSIPVAVSERLRVSFPDDGLDTHSLRYLPPDRQTANHRLYLAGAEGWERVRPAAFGSYYLVEVPGDSAELILLSTIQSWWIAAYIAAALLLLVLLILAVIRLRKFLRARPKKERAPREPWLRRHRKRLLIALPVAALAAAALLLPLRFGSVGSALSVYRVLKGFSARETDVRSEIRIELEGRAVDMSTTVHRVKQDGRVIRCTEQHGIPLYICDGMVCLENGRVFRLAEGQLSQGRVLELALEVFLHEEIEKTLDGGAVRYSAVIGGETADRILRLFLSANSEELLRAENMTLSLRTENGELKSAAFTGDGAASTGKRFRFSAELTPEPMTQRPAIPRAVTEAIENGGGENAQLLSEELLRLLAAWVKNETAETVSADIDVKADCGPVKLSPHYRYSRQRAEGTDVSCVESTLFKLYFTDSAACTAAGQELSEAQKRVTAAAQLLPLARALCLEGQFDSASDGEKTVYTVRLPGDDASALVSRLLPELDRLSLSYLDPRLRVTLSDDILEAIELDCGGSLRVVSRDVDASVLVTLRFNDNEPAELPPAVQVALLG